MRFAVLMAVAIVLATPVLWAQSPAFKCSRLTRADGLVDDRVSCILQDRRGFLWFGSHRGLNRYDGYQVQVFRHEKSNPGSLSDVVVTSMHEDDSGVLWVGTSEGGLNRFVQETEQFLHYRDTAIYPSGSPHSAIVAMVGDKQHYLWVLCSDERGLRRFDPRTGTWKHYTHNPNDPFSLSNDTVYTICRDSAGVLWVGSRGGGLNRYDPVRDCFVNGHSNPTYSSETLGRIRIIRPIANGFLYACDDGLLYHLRKSGEGFVRTSVELPGFSVNWDDGITSVLQDRSGAIWVGALSSGLYMVSPDMRSATAVHRSYTDACGLPSARVLAIAQDRFGDVWIGTDAGVCRVHRRPGAVQHFQHNPLDASTIPGREIRAIYGDADGTMWFGTAGSGLVRSVAGGFRTTAVCGGKDKFAENTINVLEPASGGNFWVGTNAGLYLFDRRNNSFTSCNSDIFGRRVWALDQEGDSVLWVGTQSGGITKMNLRTRQARWYLQEPVSEGRSVRTSVLCLLNDGNTLWVGTTAGLYKISKNTGETRLYCHRTNDSTTVTYNHVWAIYKARNGCYWVGTSGGGLYRFYPDTGRFQSVNPASGMLSSVICGILEDERGALWISTDNGLSVLEPATGKCRAFSQSDGVFFSTFHFKACYRNAQGAMYIGGMDGFVRFHPDSISSQERRAPLVFTEFKVFDKPVPLDTVISMRQQVRLAYNRNFFTVEFAILDFAGSCHHRYRYRLEGYDKQWQQTDDRRPMAAYTDVPPGNYILVVQTADISGTWGASSASLSIVVVPAWWQTWWFRGGMSVAIVLVCIAGSMRIVASLRRKSATERRLVELQLHALRAQMNPHFIFNSLNSIYYYIMSYDNTKAQRYLGVFSMLLRQILEYSRKTFISIGREIEILKMYLELEAMRFSQRFDYTITVAPDIDIERQLIPTMLLQPYVENAVKHGLLPKEQDCLLTIEFCRNGDLVECSITDNGIGREQSGMRREQSKLVHTSQGLALSQERLANLCELHGKLYGVSVHDLTTESGEVAGTRIVLTFPAEVHDAASDRFRWYGTVVGGGKSEAGGRKKKTGEPLR